MEPDTAKLDDLAGLERVFGNAVVVVYAIDVSGRVEWIQGPVEEIFGYTAAEIVGQDAALFVAPERRAFGIEQLRRQLAGELGVVAYATRILLKNGSTAVAHTIHAPRRVRGRIVGIDGVGCAVPARADSQPLVRLTPRQAEVLRLLSEGLSVKETALRLDISVGTVRNHIRNAQAELKCHTTLTAVLAARASGLI